MRIVVISQMYPCKRHPASGIFLANLMKEVAPAVEDLTILTPRPYVPKVVTRIKKRWKRWHCDGMKSEEGGIRILRPYFPYLRWASCEGVNGILMHVALSGLLEELNKAKKIDVLIGHNMLPEGIAAVYLARRLKLPVLTWAIGSDINDLAGLGRLNPLLAKRSIEKSNLVLATSKDLECKIKRLGGTEARVQTFYRGIDLTTFATGSRIDNPAKESQIDPRKPYILYVGRLIRDKGIFELAEAFCIIANKYHDVRLLLIGEEIEKEALIKKFRRYGILDRVVFKGIVPHAEVARHMKAAELLIFPSWAEGLPNAIIEAMAAGLPVVATAVGGIPEILIDGITGLTAPPKNATELARAALEMLENEKLRSKLSNNAKKLIYERFDVKKNARKFVDIIENIARGNDKFA